MRVGGRILGHPVHRAAEMADEDLAFGRRQFARVLDDRLDRGVADLSEIVRFPVVARARGEQRIEGRLPAGEGVRTDHVGDRLAERAERRGRLLARRHVTGVAECEHHDFPAVPVLGQKRQRRRLAQHHPDGQLVGRLGDEAAVAVEQLPGLAERMHDQAGQHLGADRVEPELERGHDAEIAAAAADRPEQVGMFARARMAQLAVGGDHVGAPAGCRP